MSTQTVRKPAYAYHEIAPGGGLPRLEWAIERQLSLASDYDEPALVELLMALNPDLDESISADIERLLDLGEQVATAGQRAVNDSDWEAPRSLVIDEYAEQLRKLAKLVRGIPTLPTRTRHTLGAAVAR